MFGRGSFFDHSWWRLEFSEVYVDVVDHMVNQTQLLIELQIRQLCIDLVDLKIVAEDLGVADLVQAFHHLLPIVKQAVDVKHRISTSLEILVR